MSHEHTEAELQSMREQSDAAWHGKIADAMRIAELESQNQALQGALKEAAMTVHLKHPHAGVTIGPFDSCEHALCTRYRNALSPAQETDPE